MLRGLPLGKEVVVLEVMTVSEFFMLAFCPSFDVTDGLEMILAAFLTTMTSSRALSWVSACTSEYKATAAPP